MKINAHQALSNRKVLLVPYSAHHVPTYHAWMQDPALQAATASEPLTLDEEYAMQRSWREDRDKLTFIVCLPLDSLPSFSHIVRGGVDDSPERMIGDINLFLLPAEDDDDDGDGDDDTLQSKAGSESSVIGEIELMIALSNLRRRGYGRAALLSFLGYINSHWILIYQEYTSKTAESQPEAPLANRWPTLAYLRVKINESNVGSIHLFESVGFKRTAEKANYFGEVELRWRDEGGFLKRLEDVEGLEAKNGWQPGVLKYCDECSA